MGPFRLPWLMSAAAIIVASSMSGLSQSRVEDFRLASDSPLTSDGVMIYGVATDGRTILVSSGAGANRKVLARDPALSRISGLTWHWGSLYIADEGTKAVFRVPTSAPAGTARAELVYQGAQRPRDLAFAGDLLVADPAERAVFRIDAVERKPSVFASSLPPEIQMTADDGMIAIVSPASGEVRQAAVSMFQNQLAPSRFSVWQTWRDR